jgi:glycerophosphoryl diester phosphodiesterase
MRWKGKAPNWSRVLLIFSLIWIVAMIACPDSQSKDLVPIPWIGKFPVFAISHRGFSGAAPENTLAAFKKAIDVGSDMIELDVHLSKDGEVIVIHDDTLKRTTTGNGRVADFNLQELRKLDAGFWSGSQFRGEKIPTLKEVFELARGKILLHIELKEGDLGRYNMIDLTDRTIEEVERAGMLDQVLFGSFNLPAVDRVREKYPQLPVALIYNKPWNLPQDAMGERPLPILSCSGTVLNQANLSKAHEQGIKVFVWTLDTEVHIEHFLNIGVDGIITNYPDRLINILRKRLR